MTVTRVLVFCISAFMAAVGGALAGVGQGVISADSYQPILSLTFFTVIIVVLGAAPWDAVLASAVLFLVPSYVSGAHVTLVLQLIFGATAIVYAVTPSRYRSLPPAMQKVVDRSFTRLRIRSPFAAIGGRLMGSEGTALTGVMTADVAIDDLKVRYGGLLAVDGLTLTAPAGRVTGLIGPNGAGKTTTFNACTGLVKPTHGTVAIAGHDVSRRGPSARARKGLGRTFQKMELFETLTVRENVEAGAEGVLAGANPVTQVAAKPGQRGHVRGAAENAMQLCDISELADTPVSGLSTGQRRLVELARCLAGPFGLLLLDEPSSGLDPAETERFGEILKSVVADARGRDPARRARHVAGAQYLRVHLRARLRRTHLRGHARGDHGLADRASRLPRRQRGRGGGAGRPHDRGGGAMSAGSGLIADHGGGVLPVGVGDAVLTLQSVSAGYGRTTVLRGCGSRRSGGQDRRATRPERRRQDDAATRC